MKRAPQWITETPIAHRGLHNGTDTIENTMEAFIAAGAHGYAVELDIRQSGDGEIVVFHDSDLARLTNCPQKVDELKWDQIKTLSILNTRSKISRLEDVMESIGGSIPLLIEIKDHPEIGKLEASLKKLLDKYKGPYAVQSFNPRILSWFKQNAPYIARGQLSGSLDEANLSGLTRFLLRNLLLNFMSRPHFISYEAESFPKLSVLLIAKLQKLPILLWTIKSEEQAKTIENICANFIFEGFLP